VNILRFNQPILAFFAGLLAVFGFAPFALFLLTVLALAALFAQWLRAKTARAAARAGFVFGLGLFGVGIGWIYVALHDYGDMPFLLALPATALFAALLALFPALAGYAQAKLRAPAWVSAVLIMPATWVLAEWLRGLLFTGFPWLTLGYAHSDSPLAGYAPLLGVYGVSLAAAVSAGLIALMPVRALLTGAGAPKVRNQLSTNTKDRQSTIQQAGCGVDTADAELSEGAEGRNRWKFILLALLLLWGGGALLRTVSWTQPHGDPFTVALVQGNIAQDIKFKEDALVGTLETYRHLALQSEARLTVLPETALPLLRHEMPQSLLEQLRDHARQNGGDMLIGSFERNNGSYYNSVFTLGAADEQHYRKQHLVPFGEFIPMRQLIGWFINEVLNIPMGDLARGDKQQAPLNIAGQRVAANICYEDAFGEEIIRALPQATLLVNITNDAWYGHSHAAAQHNQMSQMRALESGRMMLRATNTGVTSIIGADGRVQAMLPQHEEGVLLGMAQGYDGITPYARWGNTAVLLLIALMLASAWGLRRR